MDPVDRVAALFALADGTLVALIPVAGVVAGGLLVGLFGLANRRSAENEAARKELLEAKDQRIMLLTQERDEARSDLAAERARASLLEVERDELRRQVAGMEQALAKVRPVRGTKR